MPTKPFSDLIVAWRQTLAELEKPLAAWGQQTVDLDDPDWEKKIIANDPLQCDKAFRKRFHKTVYAMALAYLEGQPAVCREIRKLLTLFPGVVGHLCLPEGKPLRSGKDANWFRLYLAIISMVDQETDMRDELLSLAELVQQAHTAKIKVAPYLEEVAALSSRVNKYGMGSMQDALRSMTKKRIKELLD